MRVPWASSLGFVRDPDADPEEVIMEAEATEGGAEEVVEDDAEEEDDEEWGGFDD